MKLKVLLDTNFLYSLVRKDEKELHSNAISWFNFFIRYKYEIYISVISLAETGKELEKIVKMTRGKDIKILSFEEADAYHSVSLFAKNGELDKDKLKDDTKILAHAYKYCDLIITDDDNMRKHISELNKKVKVKKIFKNKELKSCTHRDRLHDPFDEQMRLQ